MFRQDSCLRALFLPWREVESRQNTTVSLSWGCQGQVWRGGGSLGNKKGQSIMEEGPSVFGWGPLWCLRQQLGCDVQGKTQDHLWVWKPSRYKRSCNRKMLRNVQKDHEFSSILILLKLWAKYEFEQALGVADGQGCLACCSPWGHKESDMIELLNWGIKLNSVNLNYKQAEKTTLRMGKNNSKWNN